MFVIGCGRMGSITLGLLSGREFMSDEKVLTKEIAEQFLVDVDSVDLTGFTAIKDDAAEILSGHAGDLSLLGLRTLSDPAVENLSKHKGRLELGLRELSDTGAKSLSRHKGILRLYRLMALTDRASNYLSQHVEKIIFNRPRLSPVAAESLNHHDSVRYDLPFTWCRDKHALFGFFVANNRWWSLMGLFYDSYFEPTVEEIMWFCCNPISAQEVKERFKQGFSLLEDNPDLLPTQHNRGFEEQWSQMSGVDVIECLSCLNIKTSEYLLRFSEDNLQCQDYRDIYGNSLIAEEFYMAINADEDPARTGAEHYYQCVIGGPQEQEIAEWKNLRGVFGEIQLTMHVADIYDEITNSLYIIPLKDMTKCFDNYLGTWTELLGFDPVTKLTELTPSQARELVAYERTNDLDLVGITTLEADVASELANTNNNFGLNSLTALSTDTAAALAKSKCTYIGLWGLDNIDADTAKALSAYEGFIVVGAGTTAVSDFANAGCNLFCINLIEDEADAHKFTKTTGKLWFFTTCETPILEVLVGHAGTSLQIGNTEITEEQARILVNYKGELYLSSVNQLSDDVAEIIADFGLHLSFDVLETVSDSAIGYLAGHPSSLYLGANLPLTKARANILCKHQHKLAFGHSSIPEEIVVILAGHRGTELSLSELTDLSDTAAQHLAKHSKLTLALENLPASAAQILRDAGHGE